MVTTNQILTNDDQMLILCLSYLITTVIKNMKWTEFWFCLNIIYLACTVVQMYRERRFFFFFQFYKQGKLSDRYVCVAHFNFFFVVCSKFFLRVFFRVRQNTLLGQTSKSLFFLINCNKNIVNLFFFFLCTIYLPQWLKICLTYVFH